MEYRSLAFAFAAVSSLPVASAYAQSVYVAPGGVYIGAGPVYVVPAATNGAAPCLAPTAGYGCGPPVVVAPTPPLAAPTVYAPNGGYYTDPTGYYDDPPVGGYYGASIRPRYGVPVVAYASERMPRPVASIPTRSAVVAHRPAEPPSVKQPAREVATPRAPARPPLIPERKASGALAEAAQIGDGRRPASGR